MADQSELLDAVRKESKAWSDLIAMRKRRLRMSRRLHQAVDELVDLSERIGRESKRVEALEDKSRALKAACAQRKTARIIPTRRGVDDEYEECMTEEEEEEDDDDAAEFEEYLAAMNKTEEPAAPAAGAADESKAKRTVDAAPAPLAQGAAKKAKTK